MSPFKHETARFSYLQPLLRFDPRRSQPNQEQTPSDAGGVSSPEARGLLGEHRQQRHKDQRHENEQWGDCYGRQKESHEAANIDKSIHAVILSKGCDTQNRDPLPLSHPSRMVMLDSTERHL